MSDSIQPGKIYKFKKEYYILLKAVKSSSGETAWQHIELKDDRVFLKERPDSSLLEYFIVNYTKLYNGKILDGYKYIKSVFTNMVIIR